LQHFFSRESAIFEIFQKRKRYSTIFDQTFLEAPAGINFYRIQTANELEEFYGLHSLARES